MKEKLIAKGDPTKGFFIDMLTRDILLSDAIFDLVDNSIDGARKLKGNGDLSGLKISITMSKYEFCIVDNCGGFSIDTAKNYAFRFGRPEDFNKNNDYSIGRFGIGMKRALFKIGSEFSVVSKCKDEFFKVHANLDDWNKSQDWGFQIDEEVHDNFESDGTSITISNLHDSVANDLSSEITINKLKASLEKTYYAIIEKNMLIEINGRPLKPDFIELFDNQEISPIVEFFEEEKFTVKIVAGLSNGNPTKAGWYIFCNDRLVVDADKSSLTGWGGKDDDTGHGLVFHNTYAMFRGLVYLEANDPFDLPLTTTKSGLDWDSDTYKYIKLKMVNAIKTVAPVIKTIKDMDIEEEFLADPEFSITRKVKSEEYTKKKTFKITKKMTKTTGRIQYDVKLNELEKAKGILDVNTNKDVGELTFKYFMEMEG